MATLGQGFYAISSNITFIKTYDPVAFFYGIGYRHRFESSFDGVTVDPGQQISYRFGAGFAVNPRVTFSTAFIGSFITDSYVEGTRIVDSSQEPMTLRLAATIGRPSKKDSDCGSCFRSSKTIEPFINIGLTDDAADSAFGISWTY